VCVIDAAAVATNSTQAAVRLPFCIHVYREREKERVCVLWTRLWLILTAHKRGCVSLFVYMYVCMYVCI